MKGPDWWSKNERKNWGVIHETSRPVFRQKKVEFHFKKRLSEIFFMKFEKNYLNIYYLIC